MKKPITLAAIVLMGTVATFGLKAHAQRTQSSSRGRSAQQQPSNDQQQTNEQQKNEQQSITQEKPRSDQGVNYRMPKKVRDKAMNPTPA
jgi:hypothetical protein